MISVRGFIVVLIVAGLLAVPLYKYWEFLTAGMRPPASTQILNNLEKNGVPDFEFEDLQGNKATLGQFAGKVVLVNFWATWCAPCVKEFPSLQNLVRHFKGDVIVLAISYDRSKEDLDSFVNVFGQVPPGFQIFWDKTQKTKGIFGTDVLPETYILSKSGKLVRKIAGEAVWDQPSALEFFADLIKDP